MSDQKLSLEGRKTKVVTNDNVVIYLSLDVILKIPLICDITFDLIDEFGTPVPLYNISSSVMYDIISLLQKNDKISQNIFLKDKSFEELTSLVNGTNYLGMDQLMLIICDVMVSRIAIMDQEEVNRVLVGP
jgi:hypothetical protein